MTQEQFDEFKRENEYIRHLRNVSELVQSVTQKVDCTKADIYTADKIDLMSVIGKLIVEAEERKANI